MVNYEGTLGILLLILSFSSIYVHIQKEYKKSHKQLIERIEMEEEKRAMDVMYNEIRNVVCRVVQMEQLLPVSKRSFVNISYSCPYSLN